MADGTDFLRRLEGVRAVAGKDARRGTREEESRRRKMAEKLLDFTQPFDVGLLDATVSAFYGTGSKDEVWLLQSLLCFLNPSSSS